MLIVEDINKSFSKNITFFNKESNMRKIIDGISFRLDKGDRLGVIGHNGSGKSTLIKLLFGSITPDSGYVSWGGSKISEEDGLKDISSLFNNNDRSFFWRLPVKENLQYFSSITTNKIINNSDLESLDFFNLDKILNTPFMFLSSGQKKIVALYRGMLKNPEILFFDEFTDSLDINNQIRFKNYVKNTLSIKKKKTIIWVSHSINEILDICNKILVLEDGKVKYIFNSAKVTREDIEKQLTKYE